MNNNNVIYINNYNIKIYYFSFYDITQNIYKYFFQATSHIIKKSG